MASLETTCSKLVSLRDHTFKLLQICGKYDSSEYEALHRDLTGFHETVTFLSQLVLSTQYGARTNIDHITARVYNVSTDSQGELRLLVAFLDRSQSPRSFDRKRFKNFGYELYEHGRKFQRLIAQIQGLQGWSNDSMQNLAENVMGSKPSLSPGGKKVSFDSSASGGSRNAPPSPFQATVEDEIDEDDPSFGSSGSQYQADPPLFPRRESRDSNTGGPDITPPRVVIRSPTDPATLESEMKTLNFDDDRLDDPQTGPSSFNYGQPKAVQQHNVAPDDMHMDASNQSLTNSWQRPRSRSEIESDFKRLTEEMAMLREPSDSGGSSHSRHSPSQSMDATPRPNNFMRPSPRPSRGRASTATSAENRPTFNTSEHIPGLLPKHGMPPYVSPRFSPLTPTSPKSPADFSKAEDRHGKKYREQRDAFNYPEPHESLPTVLENTQRPGLGPGAGRDKRASWAAEDFRQFFTQSYNTPDPPLFPQNSTPSRPEATGRTTSSKEELPPGVSQKKLPVSLEDICLGARKKVRFKRRVLDKMGVRMVEDTKILTVQVFPGLKPGSRIKHPEEGDYNPATGRFGEVWFLLVEQDHERFERRDRDLHTTVEIPLADALCGWNRTVRSICGKDIRIKNSGVTSTGWRDYFAGLGMPKYDKDNKEQGGPRGDMVVEVKVIMPPRLEQWQKEMIRRALPS